MVNKPKDAGWPSPKQLGAQLAIISMVGAFLLWSGGAMFVKRSDYEIDRYNSANTLTGMAKDVEYIKEALKRIERAASPFHGQ